MLGKIIINTALSIIILCASMALSEPSAISESAVLPPSHSTRQYRPWSRVSTGNDPELKTASGGLFLLVRSWMEETIGGCDLGWIILGVLIGGMGFITQRTSSQLEDLQNSNHFPLYLSLTNSNSMYHYSWFILIFLGINQGLSWDLDPTSSSGLKTWFKTFSSGCFRKELKTYRYRSLGPVQTHKCALSTLLTNNIWLFLIQGDTCSCGKPNFPSFLHFVDRPWQVQV